MPNESVMISEECSLGSNPYPVIGREGLRRNVLGGSLCQVEGRLGTLDEDDSGFCLRSMRTPQVVRRVRVGDTFTQYVEGRHGLYTRNYTVIL